MNICLIEDDRMWADDIIEAVESEIEGISVLHFTTESSVYAEFQQLETTPPLLFVIDMMLPWAYPSEDMPIPPSEVQMGSIMDSGLRILDKIRKSEPLAEVPAIIHSVFGPDDNRFKELPSKTLVREKSDDLGRLIRPLRSCLSAQRELPQSSLSRIRKAGDAVKISPEFMGMSVDLKKLWNELRKG